jgi:hypothetical protein
LQCSKILSYLIFLNHIDSILHRRRRKRRRMQGEEEGYCEQDDDMHFNSILMRTHFGNAGRMYGVII